MSNAGKLRGFPSRNTMDPHLTLRDALALSPTLYPIAVALNVDAVQFIRLDEAAYATASFLDSRLLLPGVKSAIISWPDVREAAASLGARCQFIFHISHVGSTLLSRLLGQHPCIFSVREPAILRHSTGVYAKLGGPACPWTRAEFDERLRTFLALWSRTFQPRQVAVIKATSYVSEIAEYLLELAPEARAVLMFVSPTIFLKTLLGGAMGDIDKHSEDRMRRLDRWLGDVSRWVAPLSAGERVAMSWLSEMLALEGAAQRAAGRVVWIDFDSFLTNPAAGLQFALEHFGVEFSEPMIREMLAGPVLRQYAKAPQCPFTAESRRQLLQTAASRHADEIQKGLNWLDRLASDCARVRDLLGATKHLSNFKRN